MEGRVCHIIGAGDFFGLQKINPGDLVIAADGGYRYLLEKGVKPDIIIGDFDSLGSIPRGANVITLPKEKNDTDMGAAANEGMCRGYLNFVLYGATGGRVEHTLANLQLLAMLSSLGAHALIDAGETCFAAVTDDAVRFDAHDGGYVSVFSHTDVSSGVCLRGLKYELENHELKNTFSLGVSNEFCGRASEISVTHGTLIVVYPGDAHPIYQSNNITTKKQKQDGN